MLLELQQRDQLRSSAVLLEILLEKLTMIADYNSFLKGVQVGLRLKTWEAGSNPRPPKEVSRIVTEDGDPIITESGDYIVTEQVVI